MYADQNELTVLVDLALIMAQGQGAFEVGKVTGLHTSVMGYAPLIFNLQEGCSIEEFMNLCRDVWQNLKADPELPTKLVGIFQSQSQFIRYVIYCAMLHACANVMHQPSELNDNMSAGFMFDVLTQHGNSKKLAA